jgi:hypothetical protein
MGSYKNYRFTITKKAFDNEHFGVGDLNGKVDLTVKKLCNNFHEGEPDDPAMEVYVGVPNYEGAHRPEHLPSTGEMISDHDLWMRNLQFWFDRHQDCIVPHIDSVEEVRVDSDFSLIWDWQNGK